MDMEKEQGADVITAGFPCQDISFAGEGAGLAGERSGLWWQVRRTIRMVRPQFALLENVAALLNRGMGTVLGSLAQIGYDTEWNCIRASRVGLPQNRSRAWIVAYPQCEGRERPIAYNQVFVGQKKAHAFPCYGTLRRKLALDVSRECIRAGDGVPVQPYRHRIKSCGNAVVPQIPELIGHAILEYEKNRKKYDQKMDE